MLLGVGLAAAAAGALLSTAADGEVKAPNGDSEAALAAYRQAVADAERDRIEAVAEADSTWPAG